MKTHQRLFSRAAMTLLLMLLTTATAWALKTETVSYTVARSDSYPGNIITISSGGTETASWTASGTNGFYDWEANKICNLANGMTVKPSQHVNVNSTTSTISPNTTFTFTAPNDIAIISVQFKMGTVNVAASSTSEPGSTFTVTFNETTGFNGFEVTYGYISGSCGSNATWTLSKQNKKYTALTISGSGAVNDYIYTTVSELWRTTAPWGWQDLKSVTIGNSITSIGDYAFIGCQQLSSLTIGSGVTTIGTNAFDHCDGLTTVTLPASVSTLSGGAFRNCVGLTRVNIQKNNGLVTLGNNAFYGCSALQYIVAPTPALAVQYKSASNWSALASKLRVALDAYLFTATNEGGTAAYEIANGDDLRNLASYINASSLTPTDITFRQTAHISLSGTFTPIANSYDRSFRSTYDGGGYVISGLSVSGNSYTALFGQLSGATIKNVVLMNPVVSGTGNYVAALVGYMSTGSTVTNCYAYGTGSLIGFAMNNTTRTNVCRAYKITLGSGISSVTPTATDITNGFIYNNEKYYREGLALTLNSNLSAGTTQYLSYKANGNAYDGSTYTVNSSDGDVTLTAELAYNTYSVVFDGNGATNGTMSDQVFTYGTTQALTANAFTRTGYTFDGWATSANGEVVYTDQQSINNLTTTNGGTVNLYAHWTPISYTVVFNGNGATGGSMSDMNFTYDAAQTLTANGFTRTGYTFAGWATTADGNVVYTDQQSVSNLTTGSAVTLYAKWTANTYRVHFLATGGAGQMYDQNFTYDVAQNLTANGFTRKGYTFAGWATTADGNVVYTNQQSVINLTSSNGATVDLYAKWTPITYTVHFDKNHNDATGSMSDMNFTYDAAQTLTANAFTRTDYTFVGWATSANGNVVYTDQQRVNNLTATNGGTVTLYAKWTHITYTITYHNNGGTLSTDKNSYTVESADITLDEPTRAGYTFGGWYTNEGLTGDAVTTIAAGSTEDKEFWAKWTPITYTVHFVKNHEDATGSMSDMSFTYDEAQNLTANAFTRTDYTFVGWATSANGNVVYTDRQRVNNLTATNGGTVTLYAKWTHIAYTITYHNNGGTLSTDKNSYTVESADITLDEPTRTGYTFVGWYTNEGLTGDAVTTIATGSTENKEFWAKWSPNTYTVHFDKNHNDATGSMSDMNFTYDEAQNLTANAFTRTGYTFVGWATSANGPVVYTDQQSVNNLTTIDHGEVTLYAKWGITYIDADGNTQYCSDYTVLTSSTNISDIRSGWYVVFGNVSFSNKFCCTSGDIHLILCDNAHLSVNCSSTDNAIDLGYGSLTVFAQSTGSKMGRLTATSSNRTGIYLYGNFTVCGGKINATGSNDYQLGICADKNITIHGGQVNATGHYGIRSRDGNITLGLRHNTTDFINASSYEGNVCVADGQVLYYEDGNTRHALTGTLNNGTIAGKTLKAAIGIDLADNADNAATISDSDGTVAVVTLQGRTLYKDGDWNTLRLPFDLVLEGSPIEGAEARTLSTASLENGTLTLNFSEPVTELTAGTPYIIKWLAPDLVISSASEWETFATNVSNGTESYENKVVKLAADINVSTMVGTHDHPFKGVFEGNGHTLTVAIDNSDSGSGDENQGVAPFRFTSGATIKNLTVEGTIGTSARKYAAGIIGKTVDGTNTIEHCRVGAEIHSTINGDGTHGGFVGKVSGTTVIRNCRFDGALTTTQSNGTHSCGGFVGWNSGTLTISNSLYAPTLPDGKYAIGTSNSATFARNYTMPANSHNYYTETLGSTQGELAASNNADLLSALGSNWEIVEGKVVPKLNPNLVNPVFVGVTIDKTNRDFTSTDGKVTFKGTYDPVVLQANDKSKLFLGGNNSLYWPETDITVNAFRAYFELSDGNAQVKSFVLNFDGERPTLVSLPSGREEADAWYSIDGRRLSGKPSKAGIYIHNGKKIAIK